MSPEEELKGVALDTAGDGVVDRKWGGRGGGGSGCGCGGRCS